MENVLEALRFLSSSKVTERKKGIDQLLRTSFLNHDVISEISSLSKRIAGKGGASFVGYSVTWEIVFDCARTCLSFELEKLENSAGGNMSTQNASILSTSKSSPSVNSAARTKTVTEVVSLIKLILELGCQGSSRLSLISPESVIEHICRVLQDEAARFYIGKEYLQLLQKYVLSGDYFATHVTVEHWNELAHLFLTEVSSTYQNIGSQNSSGIGAGSIPRGQNNNALYLSTCKYIVLSLIKYNSIMLDHSLVLEFFKRNMENVASIERNGTYLYPVMACYSRFVYSNIGSILISEKLLYHILPPLFTCLSKNCLVSISSKESLLTFFIAVAEILASYVESSDAEAKNDESCESSNKLAVNNMNNLFECVVNAIELDFQQCDPKIGISKKMKVSEKSQFFQLVQIVATRVLQRRRSLPGYQSSKFSNASDDESSNTSTYEPRNKRQKLEINLNSWGDFFNLLDCCSGEVSRLYVTEMLIKVLGTPTDIDISLSSSFTLLKKCYLIVATTDNSANLKARVLHLVHLVFDRMNSVYDQSVTHNVAQQFLEFCLERLPCPNMGSTCLKIVHGIYQKYCHSDEMKRIIFNHFVTILNSMSINFCQNTAGVEASNVKLLSWVIKSGFLDWFRQTPTMKSSSLVESNAIMKELCFKCVNLVLSSTCNEDVDSQLTLASISEHSQLSHTVLMRIFKVGSVGNTINLRLWEHFCSCASQLVKDNGKTGSVSISSVVNSLSLCVKFLESLDLSLRSCKNSLYPFMESCIEQLNQRLNAILNSDLNEGTIDEVWIVLRHVFVASCSLNIIRSTLEGSAKQKVFDLLEVVQCFLEKTLASNIGHAHLDLTEHFRGTECRQGSNDSKLMVNEKNVSFLDLTVKATQILIVLTDSETSETFDLVQTQVLNAESSLYKRTRFINMFQKLMAEKVFVQNLNTFWVSKILNILTDCCKNLCNTEVLTCEATLDLFGHIAEVICDSDLRTIIWNRTIPALWSLMSSQNITLKAREIVVKVSMTLLCSISDMKDGRPTNLLPSMDQNEVGTGNQGKNEKMQLSDVVNSIAKEFFKGHKSLSRQCAEGFLKLCNQTTYNMNCVLEALSAQINLTWKRNTHLDADRSLCIRANLVLLLSSIRITNIHMEAETFKFMSFCLNNGVISLSDVANVLKSYSAVFELQGERFFEVFVKHLFRYFDLESISSLSGILEGNVMSIPDLLIRSPLRFFLESRQSVNNPIVTNSLTAVLSSIDFQKLESYDQQRLFSSWFSTSFLNNSEKPTLQTFNQTFNTELPVTRFNHLISDSFAKIIVDVFLMSCGDANQCKQSVRSCIEFMSDSANVGTLDSFIYPTQLIVLQLFKNSFAHLDGRSVEFIEALELNQAFVEFLSSEEYCSSYCFYLETFIAILAPMLFQFEGFWKSQPVANISSVCKSILSVTSYAVQCKWQPIKFYLPLICELILNCCKFHGKKKFLVKKMESAVGSLLGSCYVSEATIFDVSHAEMLHEMCRIITDSEGMEKLFSDQVLLTQCCNDQSENSLRGIIDRINQNLKQCPKNIYCLRTLFRAIIPALVSMPRDILLRQTSFEETCFLILSQIQSEQNPLRNDNRHVLDLVDVEIKMNLMELVSQYQSRIGSWQPVKNVESTDSACMNNQTMLLKVFTVLLNKTDRHDPNLSYLSISASHQLANKFPKETENILSSQSQNIYFVQKINECFENESVSALEASELRNPAPIATVLTDVQYLLLDLFSGAASEHVLTDSFGCLQHVFLACPEVACNLLPVFCAIVSAETRESISQAFEQKFLEFLTDDCCQESVMSYFECFTELMKLHQGQLPNVSHLNWLNIDASLLCRVAYKLKHYALAVMFCEIGIMGETSFDMNYSSYIPIDAYCSTDLQQIAIKASLAGSKNGCDDSAVGFGIERSSSIELEMMSHTSCSQEGDKNVASILSCMKKFVSLGTSLKDHQINPELIFKVLNESPVADFADLLSLSQLSIQSDEKVFGSETMRSSVKYDRQVSHEYMKQMSNWSQLEFLEKTSNFDSFFFSEVENLGQVETEEHSKLNLCSELLMNEIRFDNFSVEAISCAVFKLQNYRYLFGHAGSDFAAQSVPRLKWDESLGTERLDNLFMFQKLVLDAVSSKSVTNNSSNPSVVVLADEVGREYVDFLTDRKRFHAAEMILDLLKEKNSSLCVPPSHLSYETAFCKLLWSKGNRSQAMSRMTKLVNSSNSNMTSEKEKAQSQLQLARFHIEACSETPTNILKLLEDALLMSNPDLTVSQQCHLNLAKFADEQYVKVDQFLRSEENQRVKNRIKITERELDCMNTQAATECRYYREIRSRQLRDVKQQEMYVGQRGQFLEKALQSYLTWMKNTQSGGPKHNEGGQDLALFRVISLWFANDNDKNLASFIASRIFDISVDHFVNVIPQLVGRLPSAEQSSPLAGGLFYEILHKLLVNICNKHFFHAIYNLLAVINAQMETKYNKRLKHSSLDTKRIDAAVAVIDGLQGKHRELKGVKVLVEAYLETAYADRGKYKNQYVTADFTRNTKLVLVKNLTSVPVPTIELEIDPDGDYTKLPSIVGFDRSFSVCGGINAPRVVKVNSSDGKTLKQLVKGNDDLRQDAVMQQVFGLCNRLLNQNAAARKRSLCMKTYKVVPLAPNCGVLEWCEGTIPLGDYLCGSKAGNKSDNGAHQRYRPNDWTNRDCQMKMAKCRETSGSDDSTLLKEFEKVCQNFQPVLHFFFLETFRDAEVWFEKRTCFTRSVATSSMIGYIVGLGDRHTSNILLSTMSAEIVHIDLGMAFEQGKELSVPETVPFRLTRDLVSAFGVSSVEGVFRKACELTMTVLRQNHDVITTIAQVLVHDPLYNWTLSPVKALMMEGEDFEENNNPAASTLLSVGGRDLVDQSDTRKNQSAVRVLERICAKLRGMDGSGRDLKISGRKQ